ncbi:MAG: hypothetical protein HONBIEJF_01812 [Fimbriimonadaceae bacterium]|nr:hypothetical protein [Fimbriimonadaceae bacterium]
MKMHSFLLALSLSAMTAIAAAQDVSTSQEGLVTISAKGSDVRVVLHDLFTQSKKSFVLETEDKRSLYLSLAGVEFEEALEIICKTANLSYEVQNGIFFLNRTKPKAQPSKEHKPIIEKPKAEAPKFSEADLSRRVNTKLPKTDLRAVMQEFAKQTGVPITVDATVPAYKLDAFLVNTSLKYAMELISRAARLQYKMEPGGIRIWKPDENRITVHNPDGQK